MSPQQTADLCVRLGKAMATWTVNVERKQETTWEDMSDQQRSEWAGLAGKPFLHEISDVLRPSCPCTPIEAVAGVHFGGVDPNPACPIHGSRP